MVFGFGGLGFEGFRVQGLGVLGLCGSGLLDVVGLTFLWGSAFGRGMFCLGLGFLSAKVQDIFRWVVTVIGAL